MSNLPSSSSPALQLTHPTPEENTTIWTQQTSHWAGPLTSSQFLDECAYVQSIPLARNGGMTQWILTDPTLPPNQRPVLASCETYSKRALISDPQGHVSDVTAHGVASVFCDPKYRKRGYASRLLQELAQVLPSWQKDATKPCVASILFSDIGPAFYAREGWEVFASYHAEFEPAKTEPATASSVAVSLSAGDLPGLCALDEQIVRQSLSRPNHDSRTRFLVLPDHDHIAWHHYREEFAAAKLGLEAPITKGAIAGSLGHRVWVIWTHRIYDDGTDPESGNTLYILRLVIEDINEGGCEPAEALRAVLDAARREAAEWKLPYIKLWDPSEQLEDWIRLTGVGYSRVSRGMAAVCSLRWFGEAGEEEEEVDWLLKEKYCWC